jgi:hypothetical protein
MTRTLLFNAVMLVADMLILCRLRAKRSLVAAGGLAAVAAVVGGLAAIGLAQERFAALRLAAWAIFGHGVALLLGAALLFWRSRRGWSLAAAAAATILSAIAAAFPAPVPQR